MLTPKTLLSLLGFSKVVYVGNNQSLIDGMLEMNMDVTRLSQSNSKIGQNIHKQTVVIEESTFITLDHPFEFFENFEHKIIIFFDQQGSLITSHFKDIQVQGAFDRRFLDLGFRLDETNMTTDSYNARSLLQFNKLVIYKKLSKNILDQFPEEDLLKERRLHMDMLREPGARSDAHLVRYALAARIIQDGDVVYDCACGLGYGTSMLLHNSNGKEFVGIDIIESSIIYANALYSTKRLQYIQADAQQLDFSDDSSVDFITSFETIEHVPEYKNILKEFNRILKPGGRMMISAPNMWIDATGKDPNPYHFHAFDYHKLVTILEKHDFLIESSFLHTAPGGPTNRQAKREFKKVHLGSQEVTPVKSDWLTLLVMKNPLAMTKAPYRYKRYPSFPTDYVCTDIARFYFNPWLYDSLIQIGHRLSNQSLLKKLLKQAIKRYDHIKSETADFGACLTVLGYEALSSKDRSALPSYIHDIKEYLQIESLNVHIYRWKISLAYLGLKIAILTQEYEEKEIFLQYLHHSKPERFSPLLMTKKISSLFYEANQALKNNQTKKAKTIFQKAVECGVSALEYDKINSIGTVQNPNSFGFSELAEISDMTSQCAIALRNLHIYHTNPGKFYQLVDVKRFGLYTWNQNLQKENDKLKKQLLEKAPK